MNPFHADWWTWHADAIYLTAVCAIVWATVHEAAKVAVKKALGMPYE